MTLFLDSRLKFKVVDSLTTAIEDVCECIPTEINMDRKINNIASCIYRAPGSIIEKFKVLMEKLFTKTEQRVTFICGDHNIDLLNPNKHSLTDDFTNTVFSMSLFPVIMKSSRITPHSATLIDNIFTSNKDGSLVSSLMINDIGDHLLGFAVYDCTYKVKEDVIMTAFRRVKMEEALNAFRDNVMIGTDKLDPKSRAEADGRQKQFNPEMSRYTGSQKN